MDSYLGCAMFLFVPFPLSSPTRAVLTTPQVQTPSYRHIMPLHHQRAHLREIVINENPGLHLVWYYDKIFVKPIPAYFYAKAFWTYIESADPDVYQAAVGFMRSYNFLV